jgi:hypothetical protein
MNCRDLSSSYESLLEKAGLSTLELTRIRAIMTHVYKCSNKLTLPSMWDMFHVRTTNYNLRKRNTLQLTQCKTVTYGLKFISQFGAKIWNELPDFLKTSDNLTEFKSKIVEWTPIICKCNKCKST